MHNWTGNVVQRGTEARSCSHFCNGQAINIIHSHTLSVCLCVCVCSLRYPVCNAHAPQSSVASRALQYFSTFSHTHAALFLKKKNYRTQNVCFDFLYKFV